jgi:hypothetical protein
MMVALNTVKENYWETFLINDLDLDFLYNKLFELETPLSTIELIKILINERIRIEKEKLENLKLKSGSIYLPKVDYEIGQKIVFPTDDLINGTVISKRPGNNPELGEFSVIEVETSNGEKKLYASNLPNHKLNNPIKLDQDDPAFDINFVLSKYKKLISYKLIEGLDKNDDVIQIAGYWFLRSLLVDVNAGYLNLAEAVLEVSEGGPLSTKAILEQIELPTDANLTLTEFSLNLALQEDERFDEVGPAGETLWFLNRLEPENVRLTPKYLESPDIPLFNKSDYSEKLSQINADVFDDLEIDEDQEECFSDVTISIIYPHWRSGTLPLSNCLESLFPTAYEAPRIRFTFVDSKTGEKFPGWVIRKKRFVFGLKEWYEKNQVIPGSLIQIRLGKNPGEVFLSIDKNRPTREWVRTATVNPDGKISFTMLKQLISTDFDDRMIIAMSNPEEIDELWDKYEDYPIAKLIPIIVRELAKLNPQGHVHAQELYAALNIIKRVSPSYTLYLLENSNDVEHLGDLYFRIKTQN